MVELYGRILTRRDLAERSGALSQFAGVRLMTLGDGVERGIRVLEFRTGTGLRFTALVDRALDIGDCEIRGQAIGWHSPSGFRHPGLHEPEGEAGLGWLRSFSGLLVTGGLDHILGPAEVSAETYHYPGRSSVRHGLHGRLSAIPARLSGYGERWEDERCVLWAEGVMQQSTVFGEDLHLHRRIEADVGGSEIRITDRVENHGFARTPHMLFYHVNLGYPLLDKGARFAAPIRYVVWASHAGPDYRRQAVGYRRMPDPRPDFREQVWQHDLAADDQGWTSAALINDRLGLGFEIRTRKAQLPCTYEWQNFQSGHYTIGIEPSTHHVLGDAAARERGEMIWLEHGDERHYDAVFRLVDGAEAIAQFDTRVTSLGSQPDEDYPAPSNDFPNLSHR
ncbi:aldose 1-epimerase family protein [Lichenihabitans psoromatis]|uniref:aldose 1-epimerase family protein n=1 Tax=Lichenihabitans psoromatis TaxID=2528642 RepID=UPI001035A203|nr:aldose 1-epimerase family protein [Lichenihabitans psoromatis]